LKSANRLIKQYILGSKQLLVQQVYAMSEAQALKTIKLMGTNDLLPIESLKPTNSI
jgi:hypothetical protein